MANLPAELGTNEIYRACDPAVPRLRHHRRLFPISPRSSARIAPSRPSTSAWVSTATATTSSPSGPSGTGKTTTVYDFLKKQAASLPAPDDWIYVYNFAKPYAPNAIRVPAGQGPGLQEVHGEARRGPPGGHDPRLRGRGVREAAPRHRSAGGRAAGGQARGAQQEGRVAGLHDRADACGAGLRAQGRHSRASRCPGRSTRPCRPRSRRRSTTGSRPSTRSCRASCASSARTSAAAATPCGNSTRRWPSPPPGTSSTRPARRWCQLQRDVRLPAGRAQGRGGERRGLQEVR